MGKFKITVAGNNFKIHIDGNIKKISFLKTWFLEAENGEKAEEDALFMIGDDMKNKVLNDPDDGPEMYIQDLREIPIEQKLPPNDSDYVWFNDV